MRRAPTSSAILRMRASDQEAAILRETIAASHRIVVCAHKSPDGDEEYALWKNHPQKSLSSDNNN